MLGNFWKLMDIKENTYKGQKKTNGTRGSKKMKYIETHKEIWETMKRGIIENTMEDRKVEEKQEAGEVLEIQDKEGHRGKEDNKEEAENLEEMDNMEEMDNKKKLEKQEGVEKRVGKDNKKDIENREEMDK